MGDVNRHNFPHRVCLDQCGLLWRGHLRELPHLGAGDDPSCGLLVCSPRSMQGWLFLCEGWYLWALWPDRCPKERIPRLVMREDGERDGGGGGARHLTSCWCCNCKKERAVTLPS